jgi:hypothetical protein
MIGVECLNGNLKAGRNDGIGAIGHDLATKTGISPECFRSLLDLLFSRISGLYN